MDGMNGQLLRRLRVSISGERKGIMIGKAVIRLFNSPEYVCLRINKKRDSFIILPCGSDEKLSFRVPEGLLDTGGREFLITSKSFVTEVFNNNGLDIHKNYMIPGSYVPKQDCVVFRIGDAFEHMWGSEE